jgi:hypothetical protein
MNYLPVPIDLSHSTFGYNYFSSAIKPSSSFNCYKLRSARLWVPKLPSESFRPVFQQIDEFNFDSAFVNSDNSASHSLGQTNLRKIRPSFRDGPFGLFRRINLIAPSRFLRLDLPSISIREHINRAGFKLPADTGDAGHRPRGLR